MNKKITALAIMSLVFLISNKAYTHRGIFFFAEPQIGYSWASFSALEIQPGLLGGGDKDDDGITDDPEDVPDNLDRYPIGAKAKYTGSGPTLGIGTGIKAKGTGIGIDFSWTRFNFTGYYKKYRYDTDTTQAHGKKFLDSGKTDILKYLFHMSSGLHINIVQVGFDVRIGLAHILPNGLSMGNRIGEGNFGFAANGGFHLLFQIKSILSAGIQGWAGTLVFNGTYDGAYAITGGINLLINFNV